jgi:SAM-dependent MidA family methyltransferase
MQRNSRPGQPGATTDSSASSTPGSAPKGFTTAVPGAAAAPSALVIRIAARIASSGGWMPFDDFMAEALYAPGLGYYSGARRIFGLGPAGGSDFVTAPELSPFFGQALDADDADDDGVMRVAVDYTIVELSAPLRERQQARLARFAPRVRWLEAWPDRIDGVVIGNEVLDAMPVKLLHRSEGRWHERGVVDLAVADANGTAARHSGAVAVDALPGGSRRFAFADLDDAFALEGETQAAPALMDGVFVDGTVTEIHTIAEGFMGSLADRLQRGVAILIDYGFPEQEYYHPQRIGGTLMCHQAHRADGDPLVDVGDKDITAHVNFSGIALAAQDAGLTVLGYTSQARFLINCGLVDLLAAASVGERANAQKLVNEHEMGELFKVIAVARGCELDPIGFRAGDRSHML